MACSSSSSLVLTAVNATLEDPSFRTWSKVATDALKSAQTLKKWYIIIIADIHQCRCNVRKKKKKKKALNTYIPE